MTLMCNPLMGHISAMYSLTTGGSSFGSRFDFNAYSYQSDLSVGCEIWRSDYSSTAKPASSPPKSSKTTEAPDLGEKQSEKPIVVHISSEDDESVEVEPVFSTFKASTSLYSKSLNFLWEGRFQEVLVSAGVGLSFASRTPEFSKLGVSFQYSS